MTETTDQGQIGASRGKWPTGQEIAAMQKEMQDRFARALDDVALRKYAIEAALKVAGTGRITGDLVEHARAIHGFLAEAVIKPPVSK